MENKELLNQLIELNVDCIERQDNKFKLTFDNGDRFLIDSELSDYDKCLLLRWLRERSRSYGWIVNLIEKPSRGCISIIDRNVKEDNLEIKGYSKNLEAAFLLSFIEAIKTTKINPEDVPEYFGDDEYGKTSWIIHRYDWVDKRRFAIAVLDYFDYDYENTFLSRFFVKNEPTDGQYYKVTEWEVY